MSLLTHGGRIVPILAGQQAAQHQYPNATSESVSIDTITPSHSHDVSLLLGKEDILAGRQQKAMDLKSLEMPSLQERGLVALPTEGDGNCLYYSLSDQLYATFDHANEIRQMLAAHIANNKSYFMQFVAAHGGERRRPKRSTTSAYATRSADVSGPSEADMERRFDEMVSSTRKNGEWGSSEHLQAFCQVFKVDIKVYTMDGVQTFRDVHALHGEHREVVHVAFHDFKHYSSVRRVNTCHTGLLSKSICLEPQPLSVPHGDGDPNKEPHPNTSTAQSVVPDMNHNNTFLPNAARPTNTLSPSSSFSSTSSNDTQPTSHDSLPANDTGLAVDVYPPWDIQSIQDGLGGRYPRETIVDMLQKCRGDIDRAFAALLEDQPDPERKVIPVPSLKPSVQASRSSSPFSTGSKRSADDSEDSEDPRPAIRRGRPRKRLVSNLTLGISIRGDQNEVVSLNLRMKADAEKAAQAEKAKSDDDSQSDAGSTKAPRRSGRLSKSRSA
ncbi:hypothetical protein N7478_004667 [Penicillium angulare]|uniref:uncharacterized protein n=1 Tax=Penicillium angulare TaxID=116970 RepID=UPI0025424AF5|nr:uncharacterized protein N7478_004667 [Penicillium angulare]KAJ5279295.1 hypothetical protein N7478_004667 [Penicillium angulare]